MKVELVTDIKKVLKECFITDSALLSQYHIEAGKGIDACVGATSKELVDADVSVFGLYDGITLIGYFGRERYKDNMFLSGFFIKPEYRTKANVLKFWDIVKAYMGSDFYCGVYRKNVPANMFLKKARATEVASFSFSGNKEESVVYHLCQ